MASSRSRGPSSLFTRFVKPARRPRLGLENLEDRTVPSGDNAGSVVIPPNHNGTPRFQPGPDLTASRTEVMAYVRSSNPAGFIANLVSHADGFSLASAIHPSGTKTVFTDGTTGLARVAVNQLVDPWTVILWLENQSGVMWGSPNYAVTSNAREFTPNDPNYTLQYSHTKMQDNLAWDITLGNPEIVVAVTDSEISTDHPDLVGNIFRNKGEIAGNGIDDDGNGFVDDVNGWDFAGNDNDTRPEAFDTIHGTHVSGIIAATTNNGAGVAGVAGGNDKAKGAQIMPLKWDGPWTADNVAGSFTYAADNGAKIVNSSYNFDFFTDSQGNVDPTVQAAWDYSYSKGLLHFTSAGNNGQLNPPRGVIVNSLFVAASDQADVKAGFSNYGEFVDIDAPGVGVLSTFYDATANPPFTYLPEDGTSMSTPNAAGVAALLWGQHPTWSREQVAAVLLGTADNVDAVNPSFVGQMGTGRANSFRALTEALPAPKFGATPGLPAEGSQVQVLTTFKILVPWRFDPASMTPSNFDLRGAGPDQTFDTGDDSIIPFTINDGAAYKIGTNSLVFKFSALPTDKYRFTALSGGLVDPFGKALDGDGDGTEGDNFVRTWNARPQISGKVFEDWNGNGIADLGDPGVANATVFIDQNNNGKQDPSEKFSVTGPSGTFAFGGLANGTYNVRQVIAPGYAQTAPTSGKIPVTISSATPDISGLLFGVTRQSAIYGTVFHDLISNGIQDPTDPGLPGWNVFVDADGNGRYDVPTKTTTASTGANPSLFIPDFATVKSTAILLGTPGAIKDVNITLNITHTWDGDLAAALVAPDGTRVQLFNGVGFLDDNFINTTFDDQAAISINKGTAPFSGKFRPQQPLATFNGLSAVGQWTLEVSDNALGDSGVLGNWVINFTLANGDQIAVTDAAGHYRFDAASTGTQRLRIEAQAGWFTNNPVPPGYDVVVPVGSTITGRDFSQTQDNTPPTITSITRLDPSPAFGSTVRFLVTFNEPVTGITSNNFALAMGGGLTGASLVNITPPGGNPVTSFIVTVNTGTGDGTLGLDFTDGIAVQDRAQNGFDPAVTLPFAGQVYTVYKSTAVFSVTSAPSPTSATTVNYTVTLSKAPTGPLSASDFAAFPSVGVTIAGIGNPVANAAGTIWTVPVLGVAGNGTLQLNLLSTPLIINSPANGTVVAIDQRHPNVTSLTPMLDPNPTKGATVRYQATFDENVYGLSPTNFTVLMSGGTTGAAVTNVSGSGTTYVITVGTGTGNGALALEFINSGGLTDLAGNPVDGAPLLGLAYTVFTVAPTVTSMTRLDAPVTGAPTVRYEVTFSTPVQGVVPSSFFLQSTVGSASIVGVSGNPAQFDDTYVVTVNTGSTDGFVGLNLVNPDGVVDVVGNLVQVPYVGPVYTIVKEAPVALTIVPLDPNPTNAAAVRYAVSFSEDVTGVDATDFAISAAGLGGVTVTGVTGSASSYIVTVSTGAGDGAFRLNLLDDDTIVNFAGNPLGGIGKSNGSLLGPLVTLDRTGPAAAVTLVAGQPASAEFGPARFQVVFSEAVAGFNAAHVLVGGTAAFGSVTVTGSGTTYVVTVDGIVGTGTIVVSVPAGTIGDALGNANTASGTATVTLTGPVSPPPPTTRAPIGRADTYAVTGLGNFKVAASAGVLANDVNPDGRPVTAALLTNVSAAAGKVTLATDGSFTYVPASGFSGVASFTYAPTDPLLQGTATTVTISVPAIKRVPVTAVAAGPGAGPQVTVYNADNSLRFSFFAYPADFTGGVTVATGDVTGDGVSDVITAPATNGGPVIRVFDGVTGQNIYNFLAYAADFRGGVFLAAADVDGDGIADIVTGAGVGGGPHVQVLRGGDFRQIRNFFAYDPAFRGGVTVAAGDLTGDGLAEIVTSPAAGGGPHVKVFDGANGFVRLSFFAYEPSFDGGLNVAVGDVTGDGQNELVVGTGRGGGVRFFNGQTGELVRDFNDPDLAFAGGTRVAVKDQDGNGTGDVLILSTGPGGTPAIKRYTLPGLAPIDTRSEFPADFHGGLFVG